MRQSERASWWLGLCKTWPNARVFCAEWAFPSDPWQCLILVCFQTPPLISLPHTVLHLELKKHMTPPFFKCFQMFQWECVSNCRPVIYQLNYFDLVLDFGSQDAYKIQRRLFGFD